MKKIKLVLKLDHDGSELNWFLNRGWRILDMKELDNNEVEYLLENKKDCNCG